MGTLVLVVETHAERRRLRLAHSIRQQSSMWLDVLSELGREGAETEFNTPCETGHDVHVVEVRASSHHDTKYRQCRRHARNRLHNRICE